MSMLVESDRPEIKSWMDYGPLLQADAAQLATLQSQTERDTEQEEQVASRTRTLIAESTSNWHSDFQPTVIVESKKVFRSDYYPPSVVGERKDLLDFMSRAGKTFEVREYTESRIDSYLGSFNRGTQLGYEQELGDKWYLTMGDVRGTFYMPVEEITQIQGVGF